MSANIASQLATVRAYHERSKHHFNRYARSPGGLDWVNQPDPFRRFLGAPQVSLDRDENWTGPTYDALFEDDKVPSSPVDRASVSRLFFDSLAISAWKQAGQSRWSLRVNPSSGDLHPTECYLVSGPVSGLFDGAGVHHYSPYDHSLELRFWLGEEEWGHLRAGLPEGAFLLGLTSIHWRESWKYGERAFRYCQHDVGHALGAISIAAAALGWSAGIVPAVPDVRLARLLGIDEQRGEEAEHPDCLVAVIPKAIFEVNEEWRPSLKVLIELAERAPAGRPNRLSKSNRPWPIIEEVTAATLIEEGQGGAEQLEAEPGGTRRSSEEPVPDRRIPARRLIRQRRSAVSMDGSTEMDREAFFHMLARVTPALTPGPFRILPWRPRVALVIFVHRVRGLEPGLYVLLRDQLHRESLEPSVEGAFVWQRPPECPPGLELCLLQQGDAREAAQIISCGQEIASDGVFSVGMLAEMSPALENFGAWFYRALFWETGLIGQMLYLEAEAAGIRGTGIGCFFDDAVHQLLGLTDQRWQSLYHFTVGGGVEDLRLTSLPAYHHGEVNGR